MDDGTLDLQSLEFYSQEDKDYYCKMWAWWHGRTEIPTWEQYLKEYVEWFHQERRRQYDAALENWSA